MEKIKYFQSFRYWRMRAKKTWYGKRFYYGMYLDMDVSIETSMTKTTNEKKISATTH